MESGGVWYEHGGEQGTNIGLAAVDKIASRDPDPSGWDGS